MNARFALVDCNNFFVSCERVFHPQLAGKPVVVLSNNDGCVIARSEEAKRLEIAMGAPAFQNREKFRRHGVTVFSSNFALYGDMSARVMATIRTLGAGMEIYSIDEAFLGLEAGEGEVFGRELRARVEQWTGIFGGLGGGWLPGWPGREFKPRWISNAPMGRGSARNWAFSASASCGN